MTFLAGRESREKESVVAITSFFSRLMGGSGEEKIHDLVSSDLQHLSLTVHSAGFYFILQLIITSLSYHNCYLFTFNAD